MGTHTFYNISFKSVEKNLSTKAIKMTKKSLFLSFFFHFFLACVHIHQIERAKIFTSTICEHFGVNTQRAAKLFDNFYLLFTSLFKDKSFYHEIINRAKESERVKCPFFLSRIWIKYFTYIVSFFTKNWIDYSLHRLTHRRR